MKRYFYRLLSNYFSFYILSDSPSSQSVLLEPDSTDLRDALHPSVQVAKRAELASLKPETIILNGNFHTESDVQGFLEELKLYCGADTRLLISYYSSLWKPVFEFAHVLGLRKAKRAFNWIAPSDVENFLLLSGFELLQSNPRVLIPIYIPLLSAWVNRFLAPLPIFRTFAMVNIAVARPKLRRESQNPSVSVVVAARNEAGNIKDLFERLPLMGSETELILIEGGSSDDTWEQIEKNKTAYQKKFKIKTAKQTGKGKGDAIRLGFSLASNDVLMILDADLTVMPEDLPKFYRALIQDHGEFINGSRLVYPMEKKAMRFFNMVGNKFFAIAFSFLLGQSFKDTLCGTKVLRRSAYQKIAKNRHFFGDFDPFGDFDLIFGASRLGLRLVELPIRYRDRVYGETNISRWKHGFILLKMVIFAARKIKFV